MSRIAWMLWHGLAAIGLAALLGGVWFASGGVSAVPEPSAAESALARRARHLLIPASARSRPNPEASSSETVRAGMEHFADHCATCHDNDGSGETAMGRKLYPRTPDLRLAATQDLSDGELFYIIENGVKLTGMPAFGTGNPDDEAASWHLVHFIRRLPALSEEEIDEMESLNPRSEVEWRLIEEERRFLAGEPPLSGDLRVGPTDAEHSHSHPKGPQP